MVGADTHIEVPFGKAPATKLVTFIFGMSSGSKPVIHWQSDFAVTPWRRSAQLGRTMDGNFMTTELFFGVNESGDFASLGKPAELRSSGTV